jgi:hypothetical protein
MFFVLEVGVADGSSVFSGVVHLTGTHAGDALGVIALTGILALTDRKHAAAGH